MREVEIMRLGAKLKLLPSMCKTPETSSTNTNANKQDAKSQKAGVAF